MDTTLDQSDINSIRFVPQSPSTPAAIIAEKLCALVPIVEKLIEEDKKIREQDEKIIKDVIVTQGRDETDSPEQCQFNFGTMRSHLFETLQELISKLGGIKNCK